jgi:hypothetical protein
MTIEAALPLAVVALALGLPLVREYTAFRREWELGRAAAAATTFTLVPSLGFALAVTLPLAERPAAHWLCAVVVTILTYSAVTSALRPALAPAPQRSR